MNNFWAAVVVYGGIGVVLIASAYIFGTIGCAGRWAEYQTSWGLTTKCMVFFEDRWVPEDRIRIFEE